MKWLMTLVLALLAVYLLIGMVLYVAQRHLIYLPQPYTQSLYPELTLTVNDDSDSNGSKYDITVLCVNTDAHCNPLGSRAVLYFGGNAEPVVGSAPLLQELLPNDTAVYLLNYRGYGTSHGNPSEKALIGDAIQTYDDVLGKLKQNASIDSPTKIDVIGRSIGTGVACGVASQREVDKLALITPFDSLQAVAQAKFPLYPMAWLLKDTFRSDQRASQINSDTLLLVAGNDQLIPPKHANQLQSAFTHPVRSELINNATHNDIMTDANAQQLLKAFLQ